MPSSQPPTAPAMRLRGVRQNNLKGLDLDLPLGEFIVVTGVSGSGKSSLAFDTVYAEGQRRYVETFSPYARQFLDRMDRPQADRIEDIPPAIAIDQTNPVRTSRSTVGTMTELNDHLKLLYARAGHLFCRGCGREVRRDTPEGIWHELLARTEGAGPRALIAFRVPIPANFTVEEIKALLAQQGYIRILREAPDALDVAPLRHPASRGTPPSLVVVQDRVRLTANARGRVIEALEAALDHGHGQVTVYPLDADGEPATGWCSPSGILPPGGLPHPWWSPPSGILPPGGLPHPWWSFSTGLHCPDCDIAYRDPLPNLFSFNSPVGACETCRGFGRTIGIDWGLVIPDESKSLIEGAIKPFQTDSYSESQEDLMGFAYRRGIPTDVPWRELTDEDRRWVLEGEGEWDQKVWYGVRRFFQWLEGRSYKMHIRVLLSKYRSYDQCPVCNGARLKDDALDWRLGSRADADQALEPALRFRHARVTTEPSVWRALPGLNVHDLMGLPLVRCRDLFEHLHLGAGLDQSLDLLLAGIRQRLGYLCEVGLGYLTLDRQCRTLSGGEVQRINLTTALGTALVNTLFVLDEPSIGLHPRDMDRIVGLLRRLRDAGNTLLVVEHDPQVMLAADRILDLGPGPGEQGGELVFQGTPAQLLAAPDSLTGAYLSGRLAVAEPREPRPPTPGEPLLRLIGARANNLDGIDLEVPLNRLVVVTGVSGSGKSTLVEDVLYRALAKAKGRPIEAPGEHLACEGHELIADALLLDQSPIGRTSRSNPASYVGALDPIRKRFAATPLAKERGYTAGTFSFNAGTGRCPTCGGSGFEHLEMQFLSDVYLRCPDCNGRRYRAADPGGDPGPGPPGRRAVHRRRPGPDGHRGRCRLRRPARGPARPGAPPGGRPGLCPPGPAGADPVRRRGPAPQVGRTPGQGAFPQEGGLCGWAVVHPRRAHHRTALFRHRHPADGLPPPARSGPLPTGDRAQPRCHSPRRLAHRPGSRGRRRRWPDRLHRYPRPGRDPSHEPHRQGPARPSPRPGRGPPWQQRPRREGPGRRGAIRVPTPPLSP